MGDNLHRATNQSHRQRIGLRVHQFTNDRHVAELNRLGAKITCDGDGLRTLDSVVRAREVFGQTKLTIISQKFHNERAIFIAKLRGLDAIGFTARMPRGFHSFTKVCREQVARVKAVLDAHLLNTQPKFIGEKIRIGAGTT